MNKRFLLALPILALALPLRGASVKISDLPLKSSVSTNTFIEVADMNAATKSGKWLLSGATLWANFTAFIAPSAFTNEVRIFPSAGNLLTTLQLGNEFGTSMGSYSFAAAFNDSKGDPDTSHGGGIILEFIHDTNNISLWDVATRPGQFVDAEQKVITATDGTYFENYQEPTDAYIRMAPAPAGVIGANWFKFWPTVLDGASAVAYKLWTRDALANSGAKLISIGTTSEKSYVDVGGNYVVNGSPVLTNAQPASATLTNLSTNTISGTGVIPLQSVVDSKQPLAATLTALATNSITGTGTIPLSSAIPSFQTNVVTTNFVAKTGDTNATAAFQFGSLQLNTSLSLSNDVFLVRDAANTLAQRNGTNAQILRVYNTFTDTSNGEWGTINWSDAANVFTIGTKKLGSGSARSLQFVMGGTNIANFSTAGHLLWNTDNTYDIGSTGGSKPRTIYVATDVRAGGSVLVDSVFGARSGTVLYGGSDGNLRITDNAGSTFSRLQFGGTTASFPAIKRSTTNLVARLADDSADTGLEAVGFGTVGGGTITTSSTGATNTISVNVVLYVTAATGASLTDNAGTTEFSGVAIAAFTPVRLQPGGKFIGTAITYATGTASHTW